ncbi:MAG: NAD-dependent epimerase [Spirochaetales bacterium]|nr:NAD-dependent epimerase [Spirochaetales bacterium]
MKILVTGTAGFIGFHLCLALLKREYNVVGLDNINTYYDPLLKIARLKHSGIQEGELLYNKPYQSGTHQNYTFYKLDLADREALEDLFAKNKFDVVCHLAAQAGVRYSLENPYAYIESNITGFHNLIECVRAQNIRNFCFASTSSVYGLNTMMPFSEKHGTDHPVSLYAATKKSNELIAHAYSSMFGIPATGLRFFTVYGPWGRPDMALFKFVSSILENKPIEVYNYGDMKRDFTYVDDIVEGVRLVLDRPAAVNKNWDAKKPAADSSAVPYRIYNIGNGKPVALMDFIHTIENLLGKKAELEMLPMQPGDVYETYADTTALENDFGYKPAVDITTGIKRFIDWYRDYYRQ